MKKMHVVKNGRHLIFHKEDLTYVKFDYMDYTLLNRDIKDEYSVAPMTFFRNYEPSHIIREVAKIDLPLAVMFDAISYNSNINNFSNILRIFNRDTSDKIRHIESCIRIIISKVLKYKKINLNVNSLSYETLGYGLTKSFIMNNIKFSDAFSELFNNVNPSKFDKIIDRFIEFKDKYKNEVLYNSIYPISLKAASDQEVYTLLNNLFDSKVSFKKDIIKSVMSYQYSTRLNLLYKTLKLNKPTNIDKFINYIEYIYKYETYGNQCLVSVINLYTDYLKALNKLGERGPKMPNYLLSRHDILNTRISADNLLKEIEDDTLDQTYQTKDCIKVDGFLFIKPILVRDLKLEGQSLHHCVYSYAKDIMNKVNSEEIYFLRKDKDTPYITIGVNINENATFNIRSLFNEDVVSNSEKYSKELKAISKWLKLNK